MNNDNLIEIQNRTEEEQREMRIKAGKASGVSRKQKAELKKRAQAWLESDIGKDKEGNPITGADLMIQVAAKELSKGNPKFWELMRDTAGQKPAENVVLKEVSQSDIDEVEKIIDEQTKSD